jgi:hypothetical protein
MFALTGPVKTLFLLGGIEIGVFAIAITVIVVPEIVKVVVPTVVKAVVGN